MPRNLLFCTFGSEKYFAGKRKMAGAIIAWRSHLFSPLISILTMQYRILLVIRSLCRKIELYIFTCFCQNEY